MTRSPRGIKRPGPYAWAFFVQLTYESAASAGWVTVGFGADRAAALRHLDAYRARADAGGRLPRRARVVGGEELRSEGGDAAVLRAVEELAHPRMP